MRILRIAFALTVAIGILLGGHYYVWRRLVLDVSLPAPWDLLATLLVLVLLVSQPASFIVPRFLPRRGSAWILWPAWTWMGVIFLLVVLLAIADLVGLLVETSPREVAVIVTVLAGALTITSMVSALAPVRVREVVVPLERLPEALEGTVIAQITDVHVDPLVGRAWVESLVQKINEIEPDLVAITGDLVDGTVEQLGEHVAPLSALRPRWGSFFVTGNHEYYGGGEPVAAAEEWIEELGRLGVRALRNERVTVGDDGARLDVAGVYDSSASAFGRRHRPDVARALVGRDEERPVVLLAHQPKAIREAAQHRVDLQLSGHTHDGQIWPFKYLVRLQQPYVEGLVRHRDTWLYVSRGTGFWGPPMRLLAPAEITKIVLTRAAQPSSR
jgi:hypothetical protein